MLFNSCGERIARSAYVKFAGHNLYDSRRRYAYNWDFQVFRT
jgi:hypothetical protein